MKPGESRSLASLASLPGDELTDIELNDEYVDADTGQSEAEELHDEEPDSDEMDQLYQSCLLSSNT